VVVVVVVVGAIVLVVVEANAVRFGDEAPHPAANTESAAAAIAHRATRGIE
jgi:hypothetical protein